MLKEDSGGIVVNGHKGTWYVISTKVIEGVPYFLLEHERFGEDAPHVIVDKSGNLVMEDVHNGFDDLEESL